MHRCIKTTSAFFARQRSTKMQAGRLCRLQQISSSVIPMDNRKQKSAKGPPTGYGVKASHTAESRHFQPENKKAADSLQTDSGNGMTRWIINHKHLYYSISQWSFQPFIKKIKKERKTWHMNSMSVKNNTYLSASEFARRIGVNVQTVRRWDKAGKLKPHHKTPCGYRFYTQEQVTELLNHDCACRKKTECTDTTGRGITK